MCFHYVPNIEFGKFEGERVKILCCKPKSRNRKLIRVMSSKERLKHKCVDLSDQCRYVNPIWFRAQIHSHARMAKFT